MADIDQIIATVEGLTIAGDGSLTLAASDFPAADVLGAFFTSIIGAQSYTLAAAARAPGHGTIMISGRADVLGYPDVLAAVTFATTAGPDAGPGDGAQPAAPIGEGVTATVTGTLVSGEPVALPVVTWIKVTDISVAATIAEPFNAITYGFAASIVLSGETTGSIPITVAQREGGLWTVAVAGGAGQAVTLEQIVALLGGQALEQFLPSALVQVLQGLALSDLEITFDPVAKTVTEIGVGLTATNGWPLTTGLALDPGLHLGLAIQNPTDAATRDFSAVVTGTVNIDGTPIPAFVQVDVTGSGTSTWLIGLDPASSGVTLPSLSGLFTLAGGQGFTDSLPGVLAHLPSIQIDPLLIGFTLSPAALQKVSFGATTTTPWPIIDGFLTVEQLTFGLELAALDRAGKTVGGSVAAVLMFSSEVGLYFECRKDPATATWTFTGGLPPGQSLNLTDLVGKLLARYVTIPATAPALVLSTVSLTVVPGTSMSFTAGSVTPWPLLSDLVLDAFTLAFTYTSGATHPFTGSLTTTMTVAKVPLTLTTGLDATGDWSFTGSTAKGAKIEIGELTADLARTFGIDTVPAPVKSLSLSNLALSYDTGSGQFMFTCEADLTVEATPVAVTVKIELAPTKPVPQPKPGDPPSATVTGTKGYSATFTGQIKFSGLQFDIVFDVANENTDVFVADYLHDEDGPTTTDLQSLVQPISSSLAAAIPPDITIDLKEVKFVFLKQTSTQWAFGLRLGSAISLSELPLVGSKLPAGQTLAIDDLQVLYSSAALAQEQTKIINALLPAGVAKLPDAVGQGIAFDADVKLGDRTEHLHAGVTPPAPAPQLRAGMEQPGLPPASSALVPRAGALVPPASSTDPVHWIDVNKQFGIFSFQRVGVGYENNVLEFALDASVALGPLAFSMQALKVGSPLTAFDPHFSLDGLALTFNRPPIALGGAFLKVRETVEGRELTSYYGELTVQVTQFALKALGGWSPDADPAMFFIYLSIEAPLGGPPFLYVTGLAGGFGINTALVLPTIDEVGSYPLLPALAPGEQATPAETIAAVVPVLQHTFHPQANQYWVAAGIQFTSFEMIQAQAVVSVAFGVELQIGVVGTCSMTFPTSAAGGAALAYVEIDVVASFTPSTGLLAVDGKLSPASYILGGFVKLSGGFAFYVWFSGQYGGDFVVSLGGYHPAFDPPSNYPVVPRLQLSFALGPLKVVGQAYFALTPSSFMAGIRISATFSAGPINAWFDAGIDFVIGWAPFHYEARAWITIGCSVDLGLFTISVQVGANLQIWGPDFGGTASVDLDVVSFMIGFGAGQTPPPPLGWQTFAATFLPSPQGTPAPHAMLAARALAGADLAPATNVLRVNVTAGMIRQGPAGIDWILDPNHFRILTSSAIPANHGVWTTGQTQSAELPNVVAGYRTRPAPPLASAPAATASSDPVRDGLELALEVGTKTFSNTEVWAPTLNIGPMGQEKVASYHTIALRKYDDKAGAYTDYVASVTVAPQVGPSNTALWGPLQTSPDPNAQRLIRSTLNGFAISPVDRQPDQVSGILLLALIFGEGHQTGFGYQQPEVGADYTVEPSVSSDKSTFTITLSGEHQAALENTGFTLPALTDPWVAAQRTAILDELSTLGLTTTKGDAVQLTTMAQTALTDWPGAARIGMPS